MVGGRLALVLCLVVMALAGCAERSPQGVPYATGDGACELPRDEWAAVCGWPPFWER